MTAFDIPPVLDEESLRNESITKTMNNKYSGLYCLSSENKYPFSDYAIRIFYTINFVYGGQRNV